MLFQQGMTAFTVLENIAFPLRELNALGADARGGRDQLLDGRPHGAQGLECPTICRAA
jgi:hypothetical protein